ncbi:MAG TPA: MFS transporter [Hyphomicrobiaceae bacterium]|nr:MFS transporter [Hyphomicrobiaceae bacterium]
MTSATSNPPARAAAILIVMLSATTILSQFFRTSVTVLAPELIVELKLTSKALGMANAIFFFALMAAQVPVGILFDRIGVRYTVGALAVLGVVGSLWHAIVRDGSELIAARFLLGLGFGGSFMSVVVLCSRWYPRQRWAQAMSWVFGLSMIGVGMAGTPLAVAAGLVGWRTTFVIMAGVAALVGLLFVWLVRDDPPGKVPAPNPPETLAAALAGFVAILRLPGLLRVLGLQTVAYAVMATIMGLWAGPYLHDVHGLDAVARGNVLIAMAVAQFLGVFTFGPMDRIFDTRKRVAMTGATATILVLLGLASNPPTIVAIALLIGVCATSSYGVAVVTHARTFYPDHLVGRGATTANTAQLLGCAMLPVATGFIPSWFPETAAGYSPVAYQWIFATIAGALGAGLAIYATARDVRPSSQLGPPVPAETGSKRNTSGS